MPGLKACLDPSRNPSRRASIRPSIRPGVPRSVPQSAPASLDFSVRRFTRCLGRPHSQPGEGRRAYQRIRLAIYFLLLPRPRPWGIVPRPRHRVGPRKVFTSFAPTPLLGWVGDRTPSFSGMGKRPCSPFRADFQGEINGADLRAGHDAPSGPSGSRTLEGRRDARHPLRSSLRPT